MLAERGDEAVGAGDRVLLAHEHAVHVHQPGVDLAAGHRVQLRALAHRSNCRDFGSDRRSVVAARRALPIISSMINLGTNPAVPGRSTAAWATPIPLRRAERLRAARLAIEHSGPFAYQVVDLDHGPVGCRRTWGGAEELAHQYADLREAA